MRDGEAGIAGGGTESTRGPRIHYRRNGAEYLRHGYPQFLRQRVLDDLIVGVDHVTEHLPIGLAPDQ